MPDHVHVLLAIPEPGYSVASVMGYLNADDIRARDKFGNRKFW